VAAVRGEATPLVSAEQAARALATALSIEEAAEAGIPVILPAPMGRAVA
jgi:hypothetical protein